MTKLVNHISTLQEEIVIRVQSIQNQKEDKKTMMQSYNENIKALEAERDALLHELEDTKEKIKQDKLVEKADEILEENAKPGDENLDLVD